MKNILVVGSINADLVIQTPRMPQLGETIRGGGFGINPGGKGANQAAAIAKLGGCVQMVGCVGADANRNTVLHALSQYGVGTEGVTAVNAPTGVAVITVCGGDNCIILDAGANDLVTRDAIDANRSLFQWADFCVLQLEIPIESVVYAAQMAKQHGACVVLNPAPMCPLPQELTNLVDLFIPNKSEAELFLGRRIDTVADAKDALAEILTHGIKEVVITLGGDGCVYRDGAAVRHHEIVPSPVVDTTAAGDTFVGGVLVCLAEGKTMAEAIQFATYASSLCVSRSGAMVSVPTRSEVEAYRKTMA